MRSATPPVSIVRFTGAPGTSCARLPGTSADTDALSGTVVQACPPAPATISGTFTAADVSGGATAQGLTFFEFDELVRAIRSGATYANVHTVGRPGGEIRTPLRRGHSHGGDDKH